MTRAARWYLLALLSAAIGPAACGDGDGGGAILSPPGTKLSATSKAALDEALQDAYRTYYTYEAIHEEPFATIAAEEQAQVTELSSLYGRYMTTPPASRWHAGNVERFATREHACLAAEESEVATEMMFERLLRLGMPPDIRGAFMRTRETARGRHRMEFRSCAGGMSGPLSDALRAMVEEALQHEYLSFHTYDRVLADLGPVGPFSLIRDAEWMHVGATANLLLRRGLAVPASAATSDNVSRYATAQAACAAAASNERASVAMYDRLLAAVLPADVTRVFQNLRAASLERHLPAFEGCD